jgi:hypothetical protein
MDPWPKDSETKEGGLSRSCESIVLLGLVVLTFVLRAIAADQPIVENYVGRQVPTALVARNLDRGSGFLRPQVETAPFPNLFLVEPPIYAAMVVSLRCASGGALALEPAGRLMSAMATALGAWGLFGLVRRREGSRVALIAVAAFAFLPITLRYGRAFQPDALMLGTLLAGLRCWDEYEAGGALPWLWVATVLLAMGLALKIVSAYILVPLGFMVRRPPCRARLALGCFLILPALAWYVYVATLIWSGNGNEDGSRASSDNGAIWLSVLLSAGRPRIEVLQNSLRFMAFRGFTPLGLFMALWGFSRGDRLWRVWGLAALSGLAVLAGKLHHEYYWLALAPLVAIGIGRSLAGMMRRRAALAVLTGCALIGMSLYQARTTWWTPREWATLLEAAGTVRVIVPRDAWLVAPEALLYASDRRGCRLELSPTAVRRAAGEWGQGCEGKAGNALELVEFYRVRGARFVAIPGRNADRTSDGPLRLALQEAIRRRYNVLVDRPVVLIATLDP